MKPPKIPGIQNWRVDRAHEQAAVGAGDRGDDADQERAEHVHDERAPRERLAEAARHERPRARSAPRRRAPSPRRPRGRSAPPSASARRAPRGRGRRAGRASGTAAPCAAGSPAGRRRTRARRARRRARTPRAAPRRCRCSPPGTRPRPSPRSSARGEGRRRAPRTSFSSSSPSPCCGPTAWMTPLNGSRPGAGHDRVADRDSAPLRARCGRPPARAPGPAARAIAAATPPPCARWPFAALTIASTGSSSRSPTTTSKARPPGSSSRAITPGGAGRSRERAAPCPSSAAPRARGGPRPPPRAG